jgi:hypothetical protein
MIEVVEAVKLQFDFGFFQNVPSLGVFDPRGFYGFPPLLLS